MNIKRYLPNQVQLKSATGFTLTELMVVVAIIGIMTAIAAPSYASLAANQRVKNVASEIFLSLYKARSEAVKLDTNITLSPKTSNWRDGWQVMDSSTAILDDHSAASGVSITGPSSVTYRPSGRIQPGVTPSFIISTTNGATNIYRCISVGLSGRPYITVASSC